MADAENTVPPVDDRVDDFDSSEDEWAAPVAEAPARASAPKGVDESNADEVELAGAAVRILFKPPSGDQFERTYRMGHTIAYIKSHLEDYHGLPYDKTSLLMGGNVLIDPLSLNDLPFKADEVNVVDVDVAGA